MPTQQRTQRDDAHHQMANMLFGYWVGQALGAFAELSVADHLANGPLTAAEIAHRGGSAPESTFRLMRVGLIVGLLTMDAGIAAGHGLGADQPVASVALGRIRRGGADGSVSDPRGAGNARLRIPAAEPGGGAGVHRRHGGHHLAVGS